MLDHLVDLESDFSAIHRVGDIYSMPGPRFFQFATRLPAYAGVMQAVVQAEQDKNSKSKVRSKRPDVEHRSLDELAGMRGAEDLFKVNRVKREAGEQDG